MESRFRRFGPSLAAPFHAAPALGLSVRGRIGTSLILIAFVFLRRYGYRTAGLTIVIAAYLLLQRPAYAGLFVKPPENRDWLLLLAFGKLLYGCVMYATFFLDAREHGPIALPTFGLQNEQMQKLARGAIAVVCGTIIHMAAFYAAVALQPFITR